MMLIRVLIIASIALVPAGAPARAQGSAPYDRDLQRLAEILGALHYLRALCGANEGAKWRNEMQALVEAETPAGERRGNAGAPGQCRCPRYSPAYPTPTPPARPGVFRYISR